MNNKRYSVSVSKNSIGTVNYGVNDNMPPAGSDGRIMDTDSKDIAYSHADILESRFEAQRLHEENKGNEWSYNGRCYSWQKKVERKNYCDD